MEEAGKWGTKIEREGLETDEYEVTGVIRRMGENYTRRHFLNLKPNLRESCKARM